MKAGLLALLVSAAPLAAHAQVHKCVESGRTVYSQTPCAAAQPRAAGPRSDAAGDDDMRREIEAEFKRLQAAEEARRKAAEARREAEAARAAQETAARQRAAPDMTPCGTRGMAYVISQEAVRRVLRAPSTARFPASPVATNFLGDCKWFVLGEVDAQNAFGAMLRTSYSATLEYRRDTHGWRVHEVDVRAVR